MYYMITVYGKVKWTTDCYEGWDGGINYKIPALFVKWCNVIW